MENPAAKDDEKEVEALGQEIKEVRNQVQDLADRVYHMRSTVPPLLHSHLQPLLTSLRPPPPPSSENTQTVEAEEDEELAALIQRLKNAINSNVDALPALLQRSKLQIANMKTLAQKKSGIDHLLSEPSFFVQ